MKQRWFKTTAWGYIPVHAAGYLVTVAALVFMVPVTNAIIRNGHSVSDDLYTFFIYVSCVAFWWKWIASRTS